MQIQSRVRQVLFILLLVAATLSPAQHLQADDACAGYWYRHDCDAGSPCVVGTGESCGDFGCDQTRSSSNQWTCSQCL